MTDRKTQDTTSEDTFKEIATAISIMDTSNVLADGMNELMRMKPYAESEEDVKRWSDFIETTAVSIGAIRLRAQVMCARLKEDVGASDPKETREVNLRGALVDPKITAALFAIEDMMGVAHCMELPQEIMDAFEGAASVKTTHAGFDSKKMKDSLKELVRQAVTGEHPVPVEPDENEDEEYRIQE